MSDRAERSGAVAVRFVCTDRGGHAEVEFGWVDWSENDNVDDGSAGVFIRSRGSEPDGSQFASRLDEKCPRCGRHPRYNTTTLKKIAAAVLAANLDEARGHVADWGRRRGRAFSRPFDVSFRD
jgi:hypothetical protein